MDAAGLWRVFGTLAALAVLGGLALWTGHWALSLIGLMLVSFALLAALFALIAQLRAGRTDR